MSEVIYIITAVVSVAAFCRFVWWVVNVNPEKKK